MPTGQSTWFNEDIYFKAPNTLATAEGGVYIGQCTWYCWSKANSKAKAYPDRKLKASKLPTGNAWSWFEEAKTAGLTTGTTPKNDCIAVWGKADGKKGHVVYVETYDGANICFSEGNRNGDNDNYPKKLRVQTEHKNTIKANVDKIITGVTVNGDGKDGLFQTLTRSAFEGRATSKGFLGYIYLN